MAPLCLVDQRRLVWVDAVAPVAFTEPRPKSLRRIQFRGVRRQEQRRDSSRPPELLRRVPARSVQHHHGVLTPANLFGRHIEELLHGCGVGFAMWTDHRPPGGRIDDAEDPDRLSTVLSHDRGA